MVHGNQTDGDERVLRGTLKLPVVESFVLHATAYERRSQGVQKGIVQDVEIDRNVTMAERAVTPGLDRRCCLLCRRVGTERLCPYLQLRLRLSGSGRCRGE